MDAGRRGRAEMCEFCGETGAHGFTLTERPAHRLAGVYWDGSHVEAAAGAIRPLIGMVRELSDRRSGLWKSPIVGTTWNVRPDGFRYFAGFALDAGEARPGGTEVLDLPEMSFVTSWHGPDDGEVLAHYARMIGWIGEAELAWDHSRFDLREEYPPDVDVAKPPALRLLVPVGQGRVPSAPAA